MATYGRSGSSVPVDATEAAVAANTAAIDALMDRIRWWRQRLAHLDDSVLEPEDIEMEDQIRNYQRDTE